jgi:hypothetical protein
LPPESFTMEDTVPMTSQKQFGLLGTYSDVITLSCDERAGFSRRLGALLGAFLDRQLCYRVDLQMICRCFRSTRMAVS